MSNFPAVRGAVALALLAAGSAALPGMALAASAGNDDTLEEVVVTAERRTENLQQVSIAATVVSGDDLEAKSVVRLYDLQSASPALTITKAGLTESVNIRGIGIASGSPAVANGVATYVDGVFQPPIVSTNAFFDIANVEVLRGPQGTLVGSNSTGGAIFITSQNPSFDKLKGYAEVGAGNYGATSAQGAVNLPVSDTLAFRVAGNYLYHESPYASIGPAYTNAGSLNDRSGRIGMLWKPGSLQLLAKVESVDRNTGGYAYQPIPGTAYGPASPRQPFQLDYDSPTRNHERGTIGTLELRYEFAGGTTLRSLSGYQDKNIHNLYDSDGTSVLLQQTADQFVRERVWTQELNLISSTGGSSNWIAGAYFQRNIIDVNIHQGVFPVLPVYPYKIFIQDYKTTTGWFGQYNLKLRPNLELQTGLRYSTYIVTQRGFVDLGPFAPDLGNSHHDARPTGKVALNYTPDANNLYYAFLARGYKAGGANSAVSQFDPETVWDAELGWKATLADGHVRTQLGVYYNRYENFQFDVYDPLQNGTQVSNFKSAKIYGGEGQVQFKRGGWQADAGFAYVHSELPGTGGFINSRLLPPGASGVPCSAPNTPAGCFDYAPYTQTADSGPNVFSPEWTWNAGLQYRIAAGESVAITPRANVSYIGAQWASVSYSPVTDYLPGYTLVSALVTVDLPSAWQVQAYGDNLGDKVYLAGQSGNNQFYGQPRTYGVRVHKSF